MTDRKRSPQEFLSYLESLSSLSSEAAGRARLAQARTRQPVDIIVRELGMLPEAEIARQLAAFLGCPVVLASPWEKRNELLERLGLEFAADKGVVARLNDAGKLVLTVANPFDHETIEAVSYFLDQTHEIEVAPRSLIEEYVASIGQKLVVDVSGEEADALHDLDIERLHDIARDAPVVKFVTRIIQSAVDEGATDIHIEPATDILNVRLRRDGHLAATENAPIALHSGVISRLKILARLNIAERRLPQDGRLRLAVRGQEIDFRLSVVPSVHGETAVLRILNRESVRLDLSSLGYDATASEKILHMASQPDGMFLVTGPTGSGKTTTLYAILSQINRPGIKIFTVEDPVEYRMPGVTQLQVDPSIGLTFASALRSVLRQDPDVILVGEIRDRETAQIAVQAALTGHLVLSTLHTNSALGSFSRLRDMGVEPFLLEATIRGIIAQRLVRRICHACDGEDSHDCEACSTKGFKGRHATYELLQVSKSLRRAVAGNESEDVLARIASEDGMVPIKDHALKLVRDGVTRLEEALLVSRSGD